MAGYTEKDLTDKELAFAEGFGKHLMNMTEAAKEAGYADPNAVASRLMARPQVQAMVLAYLRAQATKWQVLVAKAKKVLLDSMEAETDLYAKDGTFIGKIPDTKARLEAARIVLSSLKRDGQHLLEDAATEEDAAAKSNIDLARNILGPVVDTKAEVISSTPIPPSLES